MADAALDGAGEDYNVYVPLGNALLALGKTEARRNLIQRRAQVLEAHLLNLPEDARARVLLALDFAQLGRVEDAQREADIAVALRPNESMVLYNIACLYTTLNRKKDALDALKKAWNAGYRDAVWTRRDPDLDSLHGDPEFDRLYPPQN